MKTRLDIPFIIYISDKLYQATQLIQAEVGHLETSLFRTALGPGVAL